MLGICSVNLTEIYSGAHPHERAAWEAFLPTLEYWTVSREDARLAGELRYALARRGLRASFQDATIAAVARRVGATVVTDNARDFELLDVPVLRP